MVNQVQLGRMQNMMQDEVDMASFAGIVAELRRAGVSAAQAASPGDTFVSTQTPNLIEQDRDRVRG